MLKRLFLVFAFCCAYAGIGRAQVPDTTISESASLFQDMMDGKKELYHIGIRKYGIDIRCDDLFVKDDVLFLRITVKNDSAISYHLSTPYFAVESVRRPRRGLQYEKAISPKKVFGLGTVMPGVERRMVFALDKLALLRGQVLKVYFYEKGGGRNFTLTFSQKDVNGVRRLE